MLLEEDEDAEHMEKQKDILVVGLASSGKSAILASMCGDRNDDFKPTDGFNVVSFLSHQGIRLNLVECKLYFNLLELIDNFFYTN